MGLTKRAQAWMRLVVLVPPSARCLPVAERSRRVLVWLEPCPALAGAGVLRHQHCPRHRTATTGPGSSYTRPRSLATSGPQQWRNDSASRIQDRKQCPAYCRRSAGPAASGQEESLAPSERRLLSIGLTGRSREFRARGSATRQRPRRVLLALGV